MTPLTSIHKKYRKTVWRPFIQAIKKYALLQEGDHIGVCVSGGKDSMLLAVLMQELQRISDFPFTVTNIIMNPGYDEISMHKVLMNAQQLQLKVHIFDTDIFTRVQEAERSPCYLCARMRRGHLYAEATRLGCNKIALGHHMSDVVETTLMGMLFGSQFDTMRPILPSKNFPGMQLIRPMFCIAEDDINAWRAYNKLSFIACACPLSDNCNLFTAGGASARGKVKNILAELKKQGHKDVESSVFSALHTLNLDTALGYKLDNMYHSNYNP
jgi:tRNA(Ile)-lysidine synthase TilS/MesJ